MGGLPKPCFLMQGRSHCEANFSIFGKSRPIGSQHPRPAVAASVAIDVPSEEVPADLVPALINRCLEGDEFAWREFVLRYERPVFGLCLRMLRHRQDAEDVAQDALVRAVRNLHTWDPSRPLMPWLMTITANRCRTAIERRRRRPTPVDFPVEPVDGQVTRNDEIAEEVTFALELLRDEYRECFVLFYQQGLDCAAISEVMDRPVGTVKTWLHRARNELADHLRRRGVGTEVTAMPTADPTENNSAEYSPPSDSISRQT